MILLGAAILTWYYANALSRQLRTKQTAQSATLHKAQGEMPLPALDRFRSLQAPSPEPQHAAAQPQSVPPAQLTIPEPQPLPLMLSQPTWQGGVPQGASYGSHAAGKNLGEHDRRLTGAAFAREAGLASVAAISGSSALEAVVNKSSESSGPDDSIASLLRPTAVSSARAKVLPTRRFLLSKGAFIDCTLETAIDSTLPGMTTCITATDTFSADGTVVLLERGTKLIGETRGQVQQGSARVFVLWTEARTPAGIVVPLDSPGADELGRSGLPGSVNRHFWDRFGAAILISTLDGAVQASVQAASHGGGPVIYNPSSPETVLTDVLKSTVNISPTVTKANGDRIQVFVARDVDFRSVYELRAVATAR
jgi:type IV secretion system protein VirB10